MERIYTLKDIETVAKQIIDIATSNIFLFHADMGMGKTTLIKAIVKALGSKDRVSSPTFSLVNEYKTEANSIYHFDLYRIENEEELYDFGIEDYLNKNAILLIEWPEIITPLLNKNYNIIEITSPNIEDRKLSFLNIC
ncbi:tRNA (adenosine(37)-N6)-threonylcarbamoyltransferase complex ATPase subunit type 1 TsaE [uncultured Lacinutrix sp.]|uniref:tRNA (adenosine(37)-N6)-threonylcarbamoyltransferase complex ATPase subunit type 1 TsaE n=1 Tax=uncultured Lacinutrix sp. TaxID=574032 RepID=UPI00260374BC|nr:tRNA (adenosine(37)-N6)-threonylcarbamoyltransferase complex ATPase subunit type 1 TsaE [uncultured Lacinutrix sp.]